MKFSITKLFLALTLLFTFNACVFEDFDEPPVGNLPGLTGNITIAEIKAQHTLGADATQIQGDNPVLEATVVGNDETGSIFKELYLQDATGGIVMRLDEVGLNGLFPIGTPVVVDLSNIYVGDYRNKYQLTIAGGDRVPAALVRTTVYANGAATEVSPTVLTLEDLANSATFDRNLSTLVAFENLQFNGGDAGVPFADVANGQDLNRTFVDCNGNELVTRTSSFSDFAGSNTPTGNGQVIGLLDVFGDTRQIKLRRLSDLSMEGERCGTVVGGNLISLADLRAQYSGSTTNVSDDTKIRGIVISDRTSGSVDSRNLFLQDGNAGIVIRFSSEHNFAEGTDLEIAVSGMELSEFRGLLQVNNVGIDNATSQGIVALPTPRNATIGEITGNMDSYESTLVKIEPATISGGPTFGEGVTVTDATGSLDIFTRNSASFSGATVPTGEGSVVAIVSEFNSPQLILNGADDVTGDGGMTGGNEEPITAAELRALFAGGASSVPADKYIEGVVVSDVASGNFNNRNIVLQTGESGVVIRFASAHTFPLGQQVRVSIGGQELSEFRNLLQVNNVPNANVMDQGAGTLPTPRQTTLTEILANAEAWESTVVSVSGLSFSSATTLAAGPPSLELTDGTNTILTFISSNATFAGQAAPSGPFTLTFVLTQYNDDYQALIRNMSDFQ